MNDGSEFERALRTWDPDSFCGQQVDPVEVLELAERYLRPDAFGLGPTVWHDYLARTRTVAFLGALPERAHRERWAETTFQAIRRSGFTLEILLDQRARAHPGRAFLREARTSLSWSYEQARRRIRSIAALLLTLGKDRAPKVAILADNCVDGACTDLGCLAYDVFVCPLDVQLDVETLGWVFDRLSIDVVVSGNAQLGARLERLRAEVRQPFRIVHLQPDARNVASGDVILAAEIAQMGSEQIDGILESRVRRPLDDRATVLFTSGSTGKPKGVVFSSYHLLTKRFARGAALPHVGDSEILLCYLPLFHTFGRYLELMGALYWGGTYVFAGNPSSENLLELLPRVRPTGLVSIPLRWAQIYERCVEGLDHAADDGEWGLRVRAVVGDRLRWGLSAAGHLEPKVFRFFNRYSVALCSGFGMTESTGGITMTPPGQYVDGSVGIALPGMALRLTDIGELQIAGPYVASYLDADPKTRESDGWLATGDLFERHEGGFYEIVDRVKDIYKNSKGRTIAPHRVESLFDGVPGVRRAFLVGDRREYNALLVVVDRTDPVLQAFSSSDSLREYLRQIVATANRSLARYERVVNFAVLGRDFSEEYGELTPKGSFRRKVIEEHFAQEISELYASSVKEVICNGLRVRIHRWIVRDQGWLESDIESDDDGLRVRGDGRRLTVRRSGPGRIRIGDLEYLVGSQDIVDVALFARQPLLWAGNPELVAFCPCKEGWDIPLGDVSPQVLLPSRIGRAARPTADSSSVGDFRLGRVHDLATQAFFGPADEALPAVEQLRAMLPQAHALLASLIRRRLETLARHPDLPVRCLAYRTLLLETLVPETSTMMPSFIDSGLPFLDSDSIEVIARTHLERQRLEALRQRLYRYRAELQWPAQASVRSVFGDIFRLIANFVRYHPEYFPEVSLELNAWILHEADAALASMARERLHELVGWWEEHALTPRVPAEAWDRKILYHEALDAQDVARLDRLFRESRFLGKSVAMAFEDAAPDPSLVPDEGVWVTRLPSLHQRPTFRVSINTITGKHYDLLVKLADDLEHDQVLRTMRWMMAISAYPFGQPVVPRFGWYDAAHRAMSVAYVHDLTVYERIREFASLRIPGVVSSGSTRWRKLFVRAMAAFFTAWHNSGRRIVPGLATPSNVVVLEPDFREGAVILSLDGWKRYESPLSLVRPLVYNFYRQTSSHYPWCRRTLDSRWIFEACYEALGEEAARGFLDELRADLAVDPVRVLNEPLTDALDGFIEELKRSYHVPLALRSAIHRYWEWTRVNPDATAQAREQLVEELLLVYGLDRHPEIARYHLFRETYFAETELPVTAALDRLLIALSSDPRQRATQRVELSELQAALRDPADRAVFSRMAFPHASPEQRLEVLAVGSDPKRVVIRTEVRDREGRIYTVREPLDAPEVGQLYRRYVQAGFPKTIAANNAFYVMLDARDEIIGGVIYTLDGPTVAYLRGIVIRNELKGRGLNPALLEDFCRRMADQGIKVVRTFFFARRFYTKHGFRVDRRWGGLVRVLDEPEPDHEMGGRTSLAGDSLEP